MKKKTYFYLPLALLIVIFISYTFGFKKGEGEIKKRDLMDRYASLVLGSASLDDIQAGDISSAERRIRLRCYQYAIVLLEDEQWKHNNLFIIYAQSFWEYLQKTNIENWSVTERRFDLLMKKNIVNKNNQ